MVLCLLRLVELRPYTLTARRFVTELLALPDSKLVLASEVRFDVVHATVIDQEALKGPWHLLYLAEHDVPMPPSLERSIARTYSVWVGVPSRVFNNYATTNEKLLKAPSPPLTGSLDSSERQRSAQHLELSDELERRGAQLAAHYEGPVTQLNLLHFNKGLKSEYVKYGQAFATVGGRRGGNPKIVGTVVAAKAGSEDSSHGKSGEGEGGWWNEIALVHYPSISHFNDMLAGTDYQEANQKHRQKALRDTVLMCTTEYDLEALRRGTAKL